MKTVIGLFLRNEDIEQASQELHRIGLVGPQELRVLTSEAAVKELLGGHQSHVLAIYLGWGLFAGLLLFGLYNFIGLVCNCGLMIFDFWIELDALFMFVGIAILITGAIAYFLQVERLNGSFRPYTYNVNHGSLLVAVEAPPELQQAVIEILYRHHGSAIKTLETRFSNYWRKRTRPMRYQL